MLFQFQVLKSLTKTIKYQMPCPPNIARLSDETQYQISNALPTEYWQVE
jgi:hypothetical protein